MEQPWLGCEIFIDPYVMKCFISSHMLCMQATCYRSFVKDVVTFFVSKCRSPVPQNYATRQATYISRKNHARSHNDYCRGKGRTITYSECVPVALIKQHAMRILLIILSPAICLVLPYFFTISHKRHYFPGKKVIEHKMWILICFTIFSETFSS